MGNNHGSRSGGGNADGVILHHRNELELSILKMRSTIFNPNAVPFFPLPAFWPTRVVGLVATQARLELY
nr:unnamed protein product [Haemonchus contortus]